MVQASEEADLKRWAGLRRAALASGRVGVSVARAVRNIATDLRRGEVMGRAPLVGAGTTNPDHHVLAQIFVGRVRPDDVLVDVGCGRGRVLSTWLRTLPDHQVVGVELDPKLAKGTARRFARHRRCRVIEGDAVEMLPADGTLLFMFNPFDRATVARLREVLEARPPSQPPLRILYSNPRHVDLFEGRVGWAVEKVGLGGGRLVPHHDLAVIDQIPLAPQAD